MKLPNTHEWRKVWDIREDDYVHRWGDDLRVESVSRKNEVVYLVVEDEGIKKTWDFKASGEIICKARP